MQTYIPFREFFCLHRKFLLYNFLARNLKLKYRRSMFGFLWTLLIPLSQVGIYYFVYKVVLHIAIPNYISFIMSGILPWTFFTSSITESLESLVSAHYLLVNAPVPIQIFPASATYTNFINFAVSTPLILALVWLDLGVPPGPPALWMVPLAGLLFVFTYALGFLLATLFVYFRDMKHLIGLITQLWLFVTPVLYRADMMPERFRWVLWLNPLSGFFISLRQILLSREAPDTAQVLAFAGWTVTTLLVAELVRLSAGRRVVEII